MRTAIVTGGAGFIGSSIVDKLIELNIKTIVIDNLSSGNLNLINKKAIFFEESINNDIGYIFKKYNPDTIFHLAAKPSVPYSMNHPTDTDLININGTVNMLEQSLAFSAKRFIFSSSSSIYGGAKESPSIESDEPNPLSPYALQKLTGEKYCRLFSTYGLDTCSLRYFNVFGQRQNPNSQYAAVIASFSKHKKEGTVPEIHGDGTQSRDFCHIDNVVHANICAAKRIQNFNGEVFNIACGQSISINELKDLFGFHSATYTKKRNGDVKKSQADISKAMALIGYSVVTPFYDGIKELL